MHTLLLLIIIIIIFWLNPNGLDTAWGFGMEMVKWMLVAVPATYINSMLRYFSSFLTRVFYFETSLSFVWLLTQYFCTSLGSFLESTLATAFRTRLTEHLYSYYFQNETYYRCAMLPGTSLPDADQCMTEVLLLLAARNTYL